VPGAATQRTDPEFDPGSVFDPVADGYQAARPGYPEALYDLLERLVGPLAGRRVLDVGAGTGIATRALAGRGAEVVAVDPSLTMVRILQATVRVPASLGRAEWLPVAPGAVDLVTFAQAWHWVRVPEAAAECRRVLADGGRLALWWNVNEAGDELTGALEQECGIHPYGTRDRQDDQARLIGQGGFAELVSDAVRWSWQVPVEHWLQAVATRSVLARLGPGAAERLPAIEAVVRRYAMDGMVTERFTTRLTVAAP
jgi:SAM-dependent methyltransferase